MNTKDSLLSNDQIDILMEQSWSVIAPYWPLKNLIAVNPLMGFLDKPFKHALYAAHDYFQQKDLAGPLHAINQKTIQWMQAFCDDGQAAISMPHRSHGLFKSVKQLWKFDNGITGADAHKVAFLRALPDDPIEAVAICLARLDMNAVDRLHLMRLMLVTLPGWAAYVQYRSQWADVDDACHPHPITQADYMALRLVLLCLMGDVDKGLNDDSHKIAAREILGFYKNPDQEEYEVKHEIEDFYDKMLGQEKRYQDALIASLRTGMNDQASDDKISGHKAGSKVGHGYAAQMVFCIDARSEAFRRQIEAVGHYETFGFAGFFGVPVAVRHAVSGDQYASCPVLLKPKHVVDMKPTDMPEGALNALQCQGSGCGSKPTRPHPHVLSMLKSLYQSLKYNFTTPFSLVETIGGIGGLWMGIKSVFPSMAGRFKSWSRRQLGADENLSPIIDHAVISLDEQIDYAASMLQMMGLVRHFAPIVVMCGHGSKSDNNAYATSLDCGACGGRHGGANAKIMAAILNHSDVRAGLLKKDIHVPDDTVFLAAEHNTTTDHVHIYENMHDFGPGIDITFLKDALYALKRDLVAAKGHNAAFRMGEMVIRGSKNTDAVKNVAVRSMDWAQVRPEWGLARNASFVIGPRSITVKSNLYGRSFLHSYDWKMDKDGSHLEGILTAPMVITHWINAQYFFSTMDNVAFGGGSKVTKNITGKIGIMQGNASDLMHGLPLQSVNQGDDTPYHETVRLMNVIYAPKARIVDIINKHKLLRQLVGNGWVHIFCVDPTDLHAEQTQNKAQNSVAVLKLDVDLRTWHVVD